MSLLKTVRLFTTLALLHSGAAYACEEYSSYSIAEIKEFRDMLGKADADPLDRMFAFEQMACSDRPNIRNYALREGLNNIKDSLVRNEILFKAVMLKKQIDVELGTTKKLTKTDKSFVLQHGGVYSQFVKYRSETEGCLSLYYKDQCEVGSSLFVSGGKVTLNYSGVSGSFALSDNGELVGSLRAANSAYYTHIPAVIKLF